jgi:hypothetical protein
VCYLIEAVRTSLPPGTEFDEREAALLDLAARQARGNWRFFERPIPGRHPVNLPGGDLMVAG